MSQTHAPIQLRYPTDQATWREHVDRFVETPQGPVLALSPGDEALEPQTEPQVKRALDLALMARSLVPGDHLVVCSPAPIPRERLDGELADRGLGAWDTWVYGSVVPRRLLKRSLKTQMHPPLAGDEVPAWFDPWMPERVRGSTPPGYSCFTRGKLEEAVEVLLAEFPRVRVKDPTRASGLGQSVVGSVEELEGALPGPLDDHGLVVEANLEDLRAWSVTVTRTPERVFTSLGRQHTTPLVLEDGATTWVYGGTTTLTVEGGPDRLREVLERAPVRAVDPVRDGDALLDPGDAVLPVGVEHVETRQVWERDGYVATRSNVDVLEGTLVGRDGSRRRVTRAVEGAERPGGASPAELGGALDLAASVPGGYAVRHSVRVCERSRVEAYRAHLRGTVEGFVLWDGFSEQWGGTPLFDCVLPGPVVTEVPTMRDDDLVELTRRLLELQSFDPERSDVPGFLVDTLEEGGADARVLERGGVRNVVARTRGDANVVLNGHWDTVVPSRNLKRDRLPVEVEDGTLHGLGACDMKSGVAAQVAAFLRCVEDDVPGVVLAIVGDEESGGANGTKLTIEEGYTADHAVLGEPTGLRMSLGQKTAVGADAVSRGTSGHGAYPHQADNAILRMFEFVERVLETYPLPPEGADNTDVYQQVTVNVGTIEGGEKVTVVPDRCACQLDVRVGPNVDEDGVVETLNRLAEEVGVDLDAWVAGQGWQLAKASHVYQVTHDAMQEVLGETPGYVQKLGTNDGKYYAYHGSQVVNVGPGDHKLSHTDHEHVDVREILDARDIYEQVARRFAAESPRGS